jgi:hypothetical protein
MKPTALSSRGRRGGALPLRSSFALALLLACSSSGGGRADGGSAGNTLILDANNYTSQSSLTVAAIPTAPGTDLTISWGGIVKDLLCHPAQSIDNVAFLKVGNMSQSDVEKKLALGQLVSTEVTTYREFHTAGAAGDAGAPVTSTMLSKLSFGTPLDPATDYVAATSTQYLLLFTHGTTLGVGAQSMVFIQPTAGETNTTVSVPDACSTSVLDFSATLSTMPVTIPVNGPWKLDWSQITKDNFGNPLDFSQTTLDTVEVGFYEGKTPADLQAHFLDVQIDATSIWTFPVPLGQKYVDLAGPETDGGGTFPGFGATGGTWAAAVLCSKCSVPAPVVFATLLPQ